MVPLSSSGPGMGSVSASATGMVGGRVMGANLGLAVGGSHSQNVVSEDPTTCLYNVPDPYALYELIAAQMGRLQAAA